MPDLRQFRFQESGLCLEAVEQRLKLVNDKPYDPNGYTSFMELGREWQRRGGFLIVILSNEQLGTAMKQLDRESTCL